MAPPFAPSKQRPEHEYLATIRRAKLKGAYDVQEPSIRKNLLYKCKPLQIKMEMILIKNYYHMTSMDENVNWMKQTHLLSKKNL